jgi:hypothetical protein
MAAVQAVVELVVEMALMQLQELLIQAVELVVAVAVVEHLTELMVAQVLFT